MILKHKIYFKLVLILILIIICISLFVYHSENVCSKCDVSFTSRMNDLEVNNFKVPISNIYEDYLNGKCTVIKRNGGYTQSGIYAINKN